jgi:hypothetical protein
MLTAERLRDLIDYDPLAGTFTWRKPLPVSGRTKAGSVSSRGYRWIQIDGDRHSAGRLAHLYMTGKWPDGDVDHINSVRDDNRWANLQVLSRSMNLRNQRRRLSNTSGRTGVWFCARTGCWVAELRLRLDRVRHVRHFAEFDDAVACRRSLEQAHGFSVHHGRP